MASPSTDEQQAAERAAALQKRLHEEAAYFTSDAFVPPEGLLNLDSLGTARPDLATHGPSSDTKPFSCQVRITVPAHC